jgi:NAD-dependent SIR2 family protein deacetylase
MNFYVEKLEKDEILCLRDIEESLHKKKKLFLVPKNFKESKNRKDITPLIDPLFDFVHGTDFRIIGKHVFRCQECKETMYLKPDVIVDKCIRYCPYCGRFINSFYASEEDIKGDIMNP